MTHQAYVFDNHEDNLERVRLEAIQSVHDPMTKRLLSQVGLGPGNICAEIGAGKGSIAQHMVSTVAPGGKVVAVDLNTRFLEGFASSRFEVRRMDITTEPLETGFYDIVHARFILLHVKNIHAALENIWRALKVGGVLLLEEPDFRTGFPVFIDSGSDARIERVNHAILAMYGAMGIDPGLGTKLPHMLLRLGCAKPEVFTDLPLAPGGSPIAVMMGMSINHLRARLVDTGVATSEDIDHYLNASRDANSWSTYYTTVSVMGRKA